MTSISIITPLLKEERYFQSALASISHGAPSAVEHIVVDGAGSERDLELASRQGSRVLTMEDSDGDIADALNQGLSAAEGDVVGWIKADDVYLPGAIDAVASFFGANQNVDVAYGLGQLIDEDGRRIKQLGARRWNPRRLHGRCFLWQPAVFIRRSVVTQFGMPDPKWKYWYDYDYWLRLEAAGATFARLPNELAGKRMHRHNRLFGTRYAHHQRAAAEEVLDVVFQRLGYVPSRWALFYGRAIATANGHSRKGSVDYDKEVLTHASAALAKNASDESRSSWAKLLLYHVEEEAIEIAKRPRVLTRFLPQTPRLSLRSLLDRKLFQLRNYPPRTLQLPQRYYDTTIGNDAPTISIVTPNYNLGEYLGRTIESVINQKYPRLEYIVQDGESTDDSVQVIRRYEGQIASWQSAPDNGQTHAINLGMQRATGDILAYLNSDDVLLPGSLAYVANFFVAHPEVDVVYGHRLLIDEEDREIGRWVLPQHDSEAISWADYIPQETMFWRRSAWDAVGATIDESFEFAMDWDLILRFRSAGLKFVRLPRFLGAFRVMEQQKTIAMIETVGKAEMNRLREREFGSVPSDREVRIHIRPYLRRHWFADKLFSIGITGERRVLRRKVA